MSAERIAIVGIGLRYPDANSPDELWENVLGGRRAFRRIPDERTNLDDYYAEDPSVPDRFYTRHAAVLRDYAYDRVANKVAGSTFRTTDMTHWLALDVAGEALADAGFPGGEGLPRERTGVVLGNSLTGEFTRANVMRLRWPYVRRTVAAALTDRGWETDDIAGFLTDLERQYKHPFPGINEDTLAGGLANTIAGRICNVFDLAGGGFTVDGACSSSLLSVASSATALSNGDVDVAIAGGVDLSIDPFEVIGFAKTGALATGEMKIYDRGSNGFWPGEGCGIVVLQREADAVAQGRRIYASIPGWGISSDGKGGITRPEATGHRRALARAYERAGYGVATVSYFEGHGTGTALGDETEIEALAGARREADPDAAPAALSSVKGNIGHTKAAAGVAGLIKATLAVHHRVIPPVTGHEDPHPALGDHSAMVVPRTASAWPEGPRRAGVSAMGFGGINSHIAICEAPESSAVDTAGLDARTFEVVAGRQDVELLLFDGADADDLAALVEQARALVGRLSFAELADVAATLAERLDGRAVRAAVVARSPQQAEERLARLATLLADDGTGPVVADGVCLGTGSDPAIGFLFPGQGSGQGGLDTLARRFPTVEELVSTAVVPDGDPVATEVAQPRIVVGSLAALRVLRTVGIEATTATGHSLGELTALHWAGAVREETLLELATTRGKIMAGGGEGETTMAGLAADPDEVGRLIGDDPVVIAGYNGPAQTVVAGPVDAVERVRARADQAGVRAGRLAVSHGFHSPAMHEPAREFAARLNDIGFEAPERTVISTVTGAPIAADVDLRALLSEQIEAPVRFTEAAEQVAQVCDLMIEVGPGRVLTGLAESIAPSVPAVAVDADAASLAGALGAVGAAFALGAPVDTAALFAGRLVRPLPLDVEMSFLANPCESAPALGEGLDVTALDDDADGTGVGVDDGTSTLELLRRRASERVELPLEAVTAETHPLDDLHLSSITVGQLVNDVTHALGRPPIDGTPNFATARLGEIASMIDEMSEAGSGTSVTGETAGIGPWVRAFGVEWVTAPPPLAVQWSTDGDPSTWTVHAPADHPLAGPLAEALAASSAGDGVLLCLPGEADVEDAGLMLAAAQDAVAAREGTRFVAVGHGLGAAGLARTLRLEDPSTRITLVDLPDPVDPDPETVAASVARVVGETTTTHDVVEARYDADGTRTVPRLSMIDQTAGQDIQDTALDVGDVLLVTGGGKGITAESALDLAQHTGAALALMGRSDPDTDDELAGNLDRIRSAGVRVAYAAADVADREAVAAAVASLTAELGEVTAVLHGAGRNEPAAIRDLTEEAFRATLAPKVEGLRAVLGAVDPDRIRLLVTFGSIIGRAGLAGEGHYATANDWMTELTVRFGAEHPRARVRALEWSVWSGAGMGEKLGVVAALERDGITPIPTETGLAILRRLVDDPGVPPVVMISGRTGGLPTLPMARAELPLARFVERALVHYPGIELITEVELSAGSDPYLADHELDGDLLFPAVLGMEAMVQVASALTGRTDPADDDSPTLSDVSFLRPVVVAPGGTTTVRVAALVRDDGAVDVAIRSEDTGYAADHFRARVEFGAPAPADEGADTFALGLPEIPLDPADELYGEILFQGKRFQRLGAYRRALAREIVADVEVRGNTQWFAPFLAQDRWLADPGARDTVMHALQACIPDGVLLPEGIERLHLAPSSTDREDTLMLVAHERSQDGDSYVYDVDVRFQDGTLAERWEGLTLRSVRRTDGTGPWPAPLLGSLAERSLEGVLGGSRAVAVEPAEGETDDAEGTEERRSRTERALERALGEPVTLRHRPDGKPELPDRPDVEVSASHGAGLTVAVVGRGTETVDVEMVVPRSDDDWGGLLGRDLLALAALVATETAEDGDVARTRVWTVRECLAKAGRGATDAVTLDGTPEAGWVVFVAGDVRIATWVTTVVGRDEPVVIAELSATVEQEREA